MNTKSEFENVQNRIQSLLLRTPRDQRTSAWEDFYFAQPNTSESHVLGYQRKFKAYAAEGIGEFLTSIEGLVTEMVRLAGIYRAEKTAPKPARKVSNNSGHYSYPTTPTFAYDGKPVEGSHLLLRYGNGTQLFRVSGWKNTKQNTTLTGHRLVNRGRQDRVWRKSTIRIHDPRILGYSAPLPHERFPYSN